MQDSHHVLGRSPAGCQLEDAEEGLHNGSLIGRANIADGVGEDPSVLVPAAEDGIDIRCVGRQRRKHDQHVPGLEAFVLLKEIEQLIAQNLYLAHWAVAGMDANGVIFTVNRQGGLVFGLPSPVAEIQDVGVEGGQHRLQLRFDEEIGAALFVLNRFFIFEQELEFPADSTERREQAVADIDVKVIGREPLRSLLLFAGDLFTPHQVDYIRPVFPAGTQEEKMHVDVVGEHPEDVEVEGREGWDSKK